MRKFSERELPEAVAYAVAGGQALHLHRIIVDRRRAPACFVRDVERGKKIGHLFDRDAERLRHTAKRLGVRVIHIDRAGTDKQHIDLCGKPLLKAIAECEEDNANE